MKTAVEALLAKAARSRRAAALLGEQDYLDFAASRAYYYISAELRLGLVIARRAVARLRGTKQSNPALEA